MGGAVQSFSSPMLTQGMQGGLSGFGTSGLGTFAKGGKMNDEHYIVQVYTNGKVGADSMLPNVEPKPFADINDAMRFSKSLMDENFSEIDKITILTSNGRLVQKYTNSDSDKNVKEKRLYKQKIPNNYQGKTAEQVWNLLTPAQRSHYLSDHENGDYKNLTHSDWNELNDRVRNGFEMHVQEGQYAKGGRTSGEKVAYIHFWKGFSESHIDDVYDMLEQQGIQVDNRKKWHTKGYAEELDDESGVDVRFYFADAKKPQKLMEDLRDYVSKNNDYVDLGMGRGFAKGGEVKEFQVGDIVTHKKGREYGHGRIYKTSSIAIYLEDKFGNKREQPFYFPSDFKKVKRMFADGGEAEVHIENADVNFDEKHYKGLLSDFDLDGLPNVDDPDPFGNQDKKSIEQVKFSKTFKKVLDTKEDLDGELKKFVSKLQNSTSSDEKIYARSKTPFSILNKLVDSRLLDEKRGLKDLVGTTITFKNTEDLKKYMKKVRRGDLGKVIDFDDYYANPNDGYRAYHFIIEQDGVPIELQLKTDRMKEVNILSHDAYKNKSLNKEYMLYLTSLANEADNGNGFSKEQFSMIMRNKAEVRKMLNSKTTKN